MADDVAHVAADVAAHDAPDRPSKSERKRAMHALQDLGEELVALRPEQLASLDLPEPVREAVAFARTVRSHEGRRRHLQYLGKLMRTVEPEPLRAALDRLNGTSRQAVATMHACERWRDQLLDDDEALTRLLQDHPDADVQALRATIRAARRERSTGAAPRQTRQLYRTLHALLSGGGDGDLDAAAGGHRP